MKKMKKLLPTIISTALATIAVATIAYGWTAPTQMAPNDNVSTPLHAGNAGQIKNGGLTVGAGFGPGSTSLAFGVINGRVGIGTINPSEKFQVAGNIRSNDVYLESINKWASTLGGVAVESDPQVGILQADKWCTSDGLTLNCNRNLPPIDPEVDPEVGAMTEGKWCKSSGGKVVCQSDLPAQQAITCPCGTCWSTATRRESMGLVYAPLASCDNYYLCTPGGDILVSQTNCDAVGAW